MLGQLLEGTLFCILYGQTFVTGTLKYITNASTDKGVNWETDKRLTNNSASSEYPSIVVSGSVVHVV